MGRCRIPPRARVLWSVLAALAASLCGADVDVVLPGGAVAGRVVDLPMLDPVDTGMSGA